MFISVVVDKVNLTNSLLSSGFKLKSPASICGFLITLFAEGFELLTTFRMEVGAEGIHPRKVDATCSKGMCDHGKVNAACH